MSVTVPSLTPDAARVLTDEVKSDAAALWSKLLHLYEGGAHTALGYSSWGAYYETEFGQASSTGYRLLEAARVVALIPTHGNDNQPAPPQNVVRELVPVLREDPEHVEEVWAEIVEEHGPAPTAVQVREHVGARTEIARSHRRPLIDEFRSAVVDLDRCVSRIDRLVADDRFPRNGATVAATYLHDLIRLRASIDTHIARLGGDR